MLFSLKDKPKEQSVFVVFLAGGKQWERQMKGPVIAKPNTRTERAPAQSGARQCYTDSHFPKEENHTNCFCLKYST